MMKDPHADCGVGCKHHGNNVELNEIESLHDNFYGKKSDQAIYRDISDDYKRRIYEPQNDQNKIISQLLKRKTEDVPMWTEDQVRKHFEHDTINVIHEIGRDIKKARTFQTHLEYNQIARKSPNGKKTIVKENVELWMKLSTHKAALCGKLELLEEKRSNKAATSGKVTKPAGTR
jgi:hypothetical protein